MKEIKMGGGHYVCDKCGKTIFGSKYHKCTEALKYDKMKNEHDYVSDRVSLEWLVLHCLSQDDPCISIGRGKELLGFKDMQEMRDFMNKNRDNDENITDKSKADLGDYEH